MPIEQTDQCPPGCERLDTHDALAARLLCSRVEAGRRLSKGEIKPVLCGVKSRFFKTSDLDRLRAGTVGTLSAGVARQTPTERETLIRQMEEFRSGVIELHGMFARIKQARDAKK